MELPDEFSHIIPIVILCGWVTSSVIMAFAAPIRAYYYGKAELLRAQRIDFTPFNNDNLV